MKTLQLLDALKRLAEEFETGDAPLTQAIVFLTIASAGDEGISMRDLAKAAGVSTSAVSRHVSTLGEWSWRKRPGLKLVEQRVDYEDRRNKPVHLTPKGRRVLEKVLGGK